MTEWLQRVVAAGVLIALVGGIAACGSDNNGGSTEASGGGGGTATSGNAVANVPFTGSLEQGVPVCYPQPKPKALTIGFSNPLNANETVNTTARGIKLAVEKLGGKVIDLDAKAQTDLQVSQVEQLVAQKVDAMIVFPLDPKALNPVLQKAKAAGIPTIGIEANLASTDPGLFTSQVWEHRDRAAYLQAKEAARLMGKGAGFAQAGFAAPVPTIEAQVARAKFWAEKFGLHSLGRVNNPSDDIAGGEKAMTQALSKYPNMDGLIAYNEETATGANAAARVAGKRNLVLIGTNGSSLGFASVKSGKIAATVQFPQVEVAKCAAWGAYDAAEGVKIPKTVLAEGVPRLINKETVGTAKTWDQQLQELYGKTQ